MTKGRIKAGSDSERIVSSIPKWSKLDRVLIVTDGSRDRRFSEKSDPLVVLQTLLVTLWFDLGVRERTELFSWSAPASTFSRILRTWTTPENNHELRDAWRSYLELLTPSQQNAWMAKLQDQADSWQDWDEAARLAGRVHSPWFQVVYRETRRIFNQSRRNA